MLAGVWLLSQTPPSDCQLLAAVSATEYWPALNAWLFCVPPVRLKFWYPVPVVVKLNSVLVSEDGLVTFLTIIVPLLAGASKLLLTVQLAVWPATTCTPLQVLPICDQPFGR